MELLPFIETRPTWGLVFPSDRRPVAGPLHTLASDHLDVTVTVLPPDFHPPPSTPSGTRHVREWWGDFTVTYHEFDGFQGLWHPSGRNWILWLERDSARHVFITQAANQARTWVHVRFLLRHFNIEGLLRRYGYYAIHGVVGRLPDDTVAGRPLNDQGGRGVLIAGPVRSGKTFLLQNLLTRAVFIDGPEDDCAVVTPDWDAVCLMPLETERVRATVVGITAIVCLQAERTAVSPLPAAAAVAFTERVPTPWPASWLPGRRRLEHMNFAPPTVPCLAAPEKATPELILAALAPLIQPVT
jgi:hypothetical protein